MTITSASGIWYDVPGDDAMSYEVIDPVTGDVGVVYVELGAICAIPGSLLDIAQQDQADEILTELFGDDETEFR